MGSEVSFGVLACLAVILTPALGAVVWPARIDASGRVSELTAWCAVWRPLVPSMLMALFLAGWELSDPSAARGVGALLGFLGLYVTFVVGRAVWRAALTVRCPAHPPVGVTGLLRPRVEVDPDVGRVLDAPALAAALAHEHAHVKHRDPLRLVLALIATDLQLGLAAPRARLEAWRFALELARDEDARRHGADGRDLARAILAVLRLSGPFVVPAPSAGVGLLGQGDQLRERVARLLRPLVVAPRRPPCQLLLGVASGTAFAVGLAVGQLRAAGYLG